MLSLLQCMPCRAEGDCYLCVLPDPGIEAVALGASESALPGTAPAEALHTFTLDSGASCCFFCDTTTLTTLPGPIPVRLADPSGGPILARSSTLLPCPAVPSGSLSGLHLPLFSTNLVSTAALQDEMVTTTIPGGQRVSICTCTWTGRHLATFTRRPGSSLYTLATKPPQLFAIRYAAHQLNLWPRVSLPETSPTLPWTGKIGDASVFRVWSSRAFVLDTSADKLSARAILCIFLGFPLDAPGWQFYHPHLAPCPPLSGRHRGTASATGRAGALPRLSHQWEPLSPQQLREWFTQRTRVRSGAARAGGSAVGGTGAGGARAAGPGGARTSGTGAAGAGGVGGAGAGDPGAGGTGAGDPGAGGDRAGGTGVGGAGASSHGGAGVTAGAGGTGGVGATGPGGVRTRGTGGARAGGVGGASVGDPGAGGTGVGGGGAGGVGAGGARAGGTRAGDPGAGGASARGARGGGPGAEGTVQRRPFLDELPELLALLRNICG
ncbi:unnamed protein product [Closterium sp. NIES-53]